MIVVFQVRLFSARTVAKTAPLLRLGHNIDIGWMTTIAVGSRIIIADNVRIAGQCFLAGYPGHPINAQDRAKGLPETDQQVGDIILEKDVASYRCYGDGRCHDW